MSEIVKAAWAEVKANSDFISVKTFSGYNSCRADPQGVDCLMSPDISDQELGASVLEALAQSRFVLPEPRKDVWIHPEATFDKGLYDYGLTNQRYEAWVGSLIERYGYKSKRALFKDMKRCSVESKNGEIIIRPSRHEKLEAWSGKGISESDYVVVSLNSSSAEVGAALRLAFDRCA
ncbi:contact-dependent growth inhibition system immunity protein [Pseudomonas sp. ES3]|jgi:hypothetical protein|uniref:contact-dependent growth inhibition system immunity protein n=1 Tax=Pseudomonas sp. ES3 TaxID=3424776 RepID=UPI003D351DCB